MMPAEAWIALAALAVTICTAIVTATSVTLSKISKNKEELDQELDVMRLSAFEEYKALRKEIVDVGAISRKEFGETVHAIREKVTEAEIWFRDKLDEKHGATMDRLAEIENRLRQLELFSARAGWRNDSRDSRGDG